MTCERELSDKHTWTGDGVATKDIIKENTVKENVDLL